MVKQVGGTHYEVLGYEPWDFCADTGLNFFSTTALKYLLRGKGDKIEDLRKALSYVKKLIEIKKHKRKKFKKLSFLKTQEDFEYYSNFILNNNIDHNSPLECIIYSIAIGSLKVAKKELKAFILDEESKLICEQEAYINGDGDLEMERAENGSFDEDELPNARYVTTLLKGYQDQKPIDMLPRICLGCLYCKNKQSRLHYSNHSKGCLCAHCNGYYQSC